MNKILITITLIFLHCLSISAQSGARHADELKIYLRNHETSWNFTFKAEAQNSFRWHYSMATSTSPRIYTLTTDHTGGQFNLTNPSWQGGFD